MTDSEFTRFEARSKGRMTIPRDRIVNLAGVELQGEDFADRRLIQFVAVGSRFQGCRFDRTRIESASFGAGKAISEYTECSFDGARIHFAPGGFARFVRCTFEGVDLREWFCFAVELVECTFSGRLQTAVFNGTVPERHRAIARRERNEFRGNDFSRIDFRDVAFRTGIDLSQQRLPAGPGYLYLPDAEVAVDRARSQVIEWQDLELRREAMALIRTFERTLRGGQPQLLLRQDDPSRPSSISQEAVDALFGLLRDPSGEIS